MHFNRRAAIALARLAQIPILAMPAHRGPYDEIIAPDPSFLSFSVSCRYTTQDLSEPFTFSPRFLTNNTPLPAPEPLSIPFSVPGLARCWVALHEQSLESSMNSC